jgi:transposase
VITDGAGRAISFALAPGQAHELPLAQDLVDCLPDVPGWVVGDKGYASYAFRQFIWNQGARPAIPARSNGLFHIIAYTMTRQTRPIPPRVDLPAFRLFMALSLSERRTRSETRPFRNR